MKLFRLRSFVAVAEAEKSVTAARNLQITPAAVSQHINDLEAELEVELFERKQSGMKLTPKGEHLIAHAARVLDAVRVLEREAAVFKDERVETITMGLCISSTLLDFPALATRIQQANAHISIHSRELSTADTIAALTDERLDAGFVLADSVPGRLDLVPLARLDMTVIVPATGAGAFEGADGDVWEALADGPWIHAGPTCALQKVADEGFQSRGLSYTSTLKAPERDARAELVAAGLGASVMLREDAERLEDAGRVRIVHTERNACPLGLAVPRSRTGDPLIRELVDIVQDLWHATPEVS